MIAIIDYGVGNLFSLKSSFAFINEEAVVTGDKKTIEKCDRIILPGVGAFADAAMKLEASGLGEVVREQAEADNTRPSRIRCTGASWSTSV